MTGNASAVTFDAAVFGAGPSGSSAAFNLARRGLRVALFDRKPMAEAGPGHVNAVPLRMYDDAGIPRPKAPEHLDDGTPMRIFTKDDRLAFVCTENAACKVDMRRLMDRLHGLCEGEGVRIFERAGAEGVSFAGNRPSSVLVRRENQNGKRESLRVTARLFVDATGMAGALRRRTPALDRHCPPVSPKDTCSAAQGVFEITDPTAARAYLERLGGNPEEVLCWLGVEGGWSTINIAVHSDYSKAEILVGCIAEPRFRPSEDIFQEIRDGLPWMGCQLVSGRGRIPLRRPYDRLAVPGLALVGDAACQVFPMHASGVGLGMIGGRLLAECVSDHADPGGKDAMHAYQRHYHRRHGSLMAGYDVLRRGFQPLDGESVDRLIRNGFINAESTSQGLAQKPPVPKAEDLGSMLRGTIRNPDLTARLLPKAILMPMAAAWYKTYPKRPGKRRLAVWSKVAGRFFPE